MRFKIIVPLAADCQDDDPFPFLCRNKYARLGCRGALPRDARLTSQPIYCFSYFRQLRGLRNLEVTKTRKRRVCVPDRSVRENSTVAKVPPSWDTPSEGRSALLRAARDADDSALNEIANKVRQFGFGDIEVNMTDSSGRVSRL